MRRPFKDFLHVSLLQVAVAIAWPTMAFAQGGSLLGLRPDFGAREVPQVPVVRALTRRAPQTTGGQRSTSSQPARSAYFGWEIDFHAGMSWSNAPGGTTTLPAAGSTFPMFNGVATRSVRSWFFGDGSALLNANLSGTTQTARITPLDAAITTSSVKPGIASPFGVRVSRALTSRVRLEFAFDMQGSMGLTEDALNAAQLTRTTFESAFNARLTGTGLFDRVVTSSLATTDGGRQILMTGALTFDLREIGRMRPYVVAGGGPLMSPGDDTTITLNGDYRYVSASGTPYRQTDTLTVRFHTGTVFATLFGAGFKWALNDRSGFSVDLRATFAPNPATVLLNWNPATIPGTPTNTFAFGPAPGIQISTNGAFQSTLGYQRAEEDIEVATGDGTRRQAGLTFGYYRRFSARTAAASVASPQGAAADKRYVSNRRWEADFSAGAVFGGHPTGGTRIASFPVGEAFTFGASASRYASSWMFGDGAVLINQIAAGFSGGVADRITALDPVLTASSLERGTGVGFGIRVSRRLTPRLRAAFVVESASEPLEFSASAQSAIEATRASFERIWNGIISTGGGVLFTNSSVRATATTTDASARTMYVTGGIEYQLTRDKRLVPFVSAAAGIARRSGSHPELILLGTYQFVFFNGGPLSEEDRVRVHFGADGSSPAGVFGAGFRYFMSARHGIRTEFRVHVSDGSVASLVDATPLPVPGTPTFSISSTTTPALVFSNTSAVRGNFTGPAITSLETFTGSGTAVRANLGVGYFWRF